MSIKHVYKQVESGMWEVGYYDPDGYWQPESEHDNSDAASKRVHYLNSGASLPIYYAYLQIEQCLWQVGYYDPQGQWQRETDHGTPRHALARVRYLNGSRS